MDVTRPTLRGLIPPPPSDPLNPLRDLELKRQWAAQYFQQALDFANAVVGALRLQGFQVQVLGNSCDPGAGCMGLPQLQAILNRGGRSMDSSIGNPVRFDSPQQEAASIADLFNSYATSSSGYQTGFNQSALVNPPPQPTTQQQVYQQQSQALQQTAPQVFQQMQSVASPLPGSVRSAAIIAPRGYTVGSPWQIVVMGPPNKPVSVAATQSGRSLGETTYGTTDANGRFEMSGTFAAETVGSWQQIWKVGGEPVGTVTFTVLPSAGPSSPASSGASVQQTSQDGATSQTVVNVGNPGAQQRAQAVEEEPWYRKVPAWAWAVAGLGALMLMRSSK
ncbi:MAG: hypothetical protein KatS3mg005_4163 [Bryobacteraceae bacterium]|nr:MAG: hypothetical protein KatS3mg005_4163 [Bryobacteraceae bacterium]